MKRKTLITSLVTIVILAGIGAFIGPKIYRDYFVTPAADKPTADLASGQSTSVSVTSLAGKWTVSYGSYAGYRVKEVLNGTDVTVTGRTKKVTGQVVAANGQLTRAKITVPVADIATDETQRDNYFRTQALQTDQYPNATFEVTQAVQLDKGVNATYQIPGKLTLHGVQKQVTVSVKTAYDGKNVQLAGSIPITFSDYQVTAPSLGFVKVEKQGSIEFFLVLNK